MDAVAVLELLVSTRPGGGPQHVLTLATGLARHGFAPIVGGPGGGVVLDRLAGAGVETVELATDRLRVGTLARVTRLIRARGVRLVHSHGKGAGLYGRLAARLAGVPAVHTFHGLHYERYPRPARAAYLALERRLARWTHTVISVSRDEEREALALGLVAPARSRIVVNGVDAAGLRASACGRAAARATLGVTAGAPVVGCAARFDDVKQLALLLEAVATLPDPELRVVLVGGGPEEPRLRAQAAAPALAGRVVFAGELADAARLFPAFDVYVSVSRKEGLPLGLLEAMALGLPVLASDIPAHREVLGPASPALVPAAPAPVAAVLARWLADPPVRARLGATNRARAEAFDAGAMVAAVAAIYGEAIGV